MLEALLLVALLAAEGDDQAARDDFIAEFRQGCLAGETTTESERQRLRQRCECVASRLPEALTDEDFRVLIETTDQRALWDSEALGKVVAVGRDCEQENSR